MNISKILLPIFVLIIIIYGFFILLLFMIFLLNLSLVLSYSTLMSLSSNIYMYYIAFKLGNANYQYDQPLIIDENAFDTLRKDVGELGLGVKTGLDVPYEALGYKGKITSRLPGHLLDFSIGQYDTYTTIQMAQYISTLANGGKRIQPHLFLDSFNEDSEGNKVTLLTHKTTVLDDVSEYEIQQ